MSLPTAIITVLAHFAPAFTQPTWRKACVLLVGTLLARGNRTVAAALRATGHTHDPHFTLYHQVLNRARWRPLDLSRRLLLLLLHTFVPANAPITVVVDEHLERRWGARITNRGHYRDAALSSPGHPVSNSGLRWICVALVVAVPWAARPWALPFLTILLTPPAQDKAAQRRHKTVGQWTQQVVRLLRHWLPAGAIHLVGDGAYGSLELAATCAAHDVVLLAPFHLDAGLYEPAPPRAQQTSRKPRVKGAALPKLAEVLTDPATVWTRGQVDWYAQGQREKEWCSGPAVWYRGGKRPVALRWVLTRDPGCAETVRAYLCTAPSWSVERILTTYMQRWSIEVTFAECRAHLGVETQRQWTDTAIARSTPALLGLFSVVTLLGQALHPDGHIPVATAAWYAKERATFSDVLRAVRGALWAVEEKLQHADDAGCILIPRDELARLLDTVLT